MGTRIVKDPDVRRRELQDAALELFLGRGYENTSMKDVTDSIGVAKGTVYHYFPTKEQLLDSVVQRLVDEDVESRREALETAGDSAIDMMKALIGSGTLGNYDAVMSGMRGSGNLSLYARQMKRSILGQAPLYARAIEAGNIEGLFNVANPLECAEFLLAGTSWLTSPGFASGDQETFARKLAALPGLIESQLNAPEGSFRFLEEMI